MRQVKFLPIIILAMFSLAFFAGQALAQPVDCCNLTENVNFEGVQYISGIWVGETTCSGGTIANNCPTTGNASANCYTAKWGMICTINGINTIVNWVFYLLVAMVGLLVIFGGFTIATAGGDSGKVNSGRNYILYAMIGLAVALLSRAIPKIVEALIG